MDHIKKLVIERVRGGKLAATVTGVDGVTRQASFTGITFGDIVMGRLNPDQIDEWKLVKDEKAEKGAPATQDGGEVDATDGAAS